MTDTTVKNNETTQKESDESTSKGDIKHIGYAGLIARRFFRQRSAVVGLIILLVLVFFALPTSASGRMTTLTSSPCRQVRAPATGWEPTPAAPTCTPWWCVVSASR